jgi:hypothetical protein
MMEGNTALTFSLSLNESPFLMTWPLDTNVAKDLFTASLENFCSVTKGVGHR